MSFMKRFGLTSTRGVRSSRSDVDLPSVKRPKSALTPQLILDRIPKRMEMKCGDEYFVPSAISNVRMDIEWARVGRAPIDVECVVMLLDADLKRVDYLTTQRRVSRDKSIAFVEEHPAQQALAKRESVGIKLKGISSEVVYIVVLFTVKSISKTLADIVGPTVSMYDMGYFPGMPELLRYTFEPEERFYPGTALVMLNGSMTGGGLQRMWSLMALDSPLPGRSFRQISDDIEELVGAELRRDRDNVSYGGDYHRVLSEELHKKALQYNEITKYKREQKPPKEAGDVETDSTSSEKSDDDSIKMFYIQNGVSSYRPADSTAGNLRPTVVRKSYRKYTTGKGVTPRHLDCESESDDEDDRLFRVTFPNYSEKLVTRYGNHTYNVGSESADLYAHYLSNREALAKEARESSSTFLKPIEVTMVPNQVDPGGSALGIPLKPPLPEIMQNLMRSSRSQHSTELPSAIPVPPSQPRPKGRLRGQEFT